MYRSCIQLLRLFFWSNEKQKDSKHHKCHVSLAPEPPLRLIDWLIRLSFNVIFSNKVEIHHSHEVTQHVFRFTWSHTINLSVHKTLDKRFYLLIFTSFGLHRWSVLDKPLARSLFHCVVIHTSLISLVWKQTDFLSYFREIPLLIFALWYAE